MRLSIIVLLVIAGCDGSGRSDTSSDSGDDSDSGPDTGSDTGLDPLTETFAVAWDSTGLTLTITGGSDTYDFAMAESGSSAGGWYGEDCGEGQGGYIHCHDFGATGGTLTTVAQPWEVVPGQTTLFTAADAAHITYAAFNEAGACVTWGYDIENSADPSYFASKGCLEITQ